MRADARDFFDALTGARRIHLQWFIVPRNVLHAFAGRLHQFRFCSFPEYSACYDSAQHVVGADAHIGPLGTDEFAADFRKNGAHCAGRCGHRPLQPAVQNRNRLSIPEMSRNVIIAVCLQLSVVHLPEPKAIGKVSALRPNRALKRICA